MKEPFMDFSISVTITAVDRTGAPAPNHYAVVKITKEITHVIMLPL